MIWQLQSNNYIKKYLFPVTQWKKKYTFERIFFIGSKVDLEEKNVFLSIIPFPELIQGKKVNFILRIFILF